MGKVKLQIEINNHPYEKDMIYAALGFRGGNITKEYILNDENLFISNYAFYNVFFDYLRISEEIVAQYDVLRAVSIVAFHAKSEEFVFKVNKVFETILKQEYSEEIFDKAKVLAKEGFSKYYKESAFRAKYKSYEFSDLNKRFNLKELINDIENIDFTTFVECAKKLLVLENICVYISGDIEKIDIEQILIPDRILYEKDEKVRVAGHYYDSYLRQDAYIENVARDDFNLIVEAFEFENSNITNFTKQLILEILAEQIPVREVDVWVDALDASMIFQSEQLRSYKNTIAIVDEKAYENAKKRLMNKYIVLMQNNPMYFTMKAVSLMLVGVYMDQYLEFLANCSYEIFREVCRNANYKISEAQVVLRKDVN